MYLRLFFSTTIFCFCAGISAFGQIIADFDFEDPANLLKNSATTDPAAQGLYINSLAEGKDGGVFIHPDPDDPGRHQNINMEVPVAAVTNPDGGSLYIETEFSCYERYAWLFRGTGLNNTGIYHDDQLGFKVRYFTTQDGGLTRDSVFTEFLGNPLPKGIKTTIGFYYDQPSGMAYLYINGQEIWKTTDSKNPEDEFYEPQPGAAFHWVVANDVVVVAEGVNGGSNEPGNGTDPSIYRFMVAKAPCQNIPAPQVDNSLIQICSGEDAWLEASGAVGDYSYLWYDQMDSPQPSPLTDEQGNIIKSNRLRIPSTDLEGDPSHTYFVVLSDGRCTSDPEEIEIQLLNKPSPPTVVETSAPICSSGNATFSLSSDAGNRFRWYTSPDPAATYFIETNGQYTSDILNQSTTFYVSTVGANSCESERVEKEVKVHPVPPKPLPAASSFELCGPAEVEIVLQNSSEANLTYNWYEITNGRRKLLHSSGDLRYRYFASASTQLLIQSAIGECKSAEEATVTIQVNELPYINAGEDLKILKGERVQLSAKGKDGETITDEIYWQADETLDRTDVLNPTASPESATNYIVTRVHSASGCKTSDTVSVFVVDKFPVPNAFSPNNDGINDSWEIPNIGNYPECVLRVFNNWGNEVYYSKGYSSPWDGYSRGKLLPAGTYYYVLQLSSNQKAVKGSLLLVR